jgi:hypothetical protein
LPEADIRAVWRAGLVHDLGRVGVSAGLWGKTGPLTGSEWERVRLHAYYTERILARPAALARLGAWPRCTTSGSTAPATSAARRRPRCPRRPASSPRPTSTTR